MGPRLAGKSCDLPHIVVDVGLAAEAGGGHRADLAKDRPLGPGPVVKAKDPTDIGVGIGVSTIQEKLVVEAEQGRIALLG
jgi:hypothetical protein